METILPILIKIFGSTFARVILATLLKGHVELDAISSGDIAETLADSLNIPDIVDQITGGDWQARRTSERVFERIGDDAAATLQEIFRNENVNLSEGDRDEALVAAKDTLNRHAMPLLLVEQLDGHDFRRKLRSTKSSRPLSQPQEDLYERILDTAAGLVFAIADQLPHFTRDTTALILQNEDRLLGDMRTALVNQASILKKTYGERIDKESATFENEYRTTLSSALDNLLLFGVEKFDGAKQPLTVAFMRLRVSTARTTAISAEQSKADEVQEQNSRERTVSIPVEKALSSANQLLIRAHAGGGKTTLLKWITVQAARNQLDGPLEEWQGRIPFYIRLRDYANEELPTWGKLVTSIRELDGLADSVPNPQWAVTQLREARGLVLLDGLDEVGREKRQETITWVENLLQLYPDTITVVSSRPSGLDDGETEQNLQRMGFAKLELLPMEDDEEENFVRRWHAAMGDEHCQYLEKSQLPAKELRLLEILKARQELRNLARTPLLCAMLCALNLFELGELPQDRIPLYKRCIEILLSRDKQRSISSDDTNLQLYADTTHRLLARIAYWMLENNPALIHRKDAERLLSEQDLDAPPVLQYLADRSVLFHQLGEDDFSFIHRTFLEFLAAKQIVNEHAVSSYVRSYGTENKRHETIRLIAAHAEGSDKAALLEALYGLAQEHLDQTRQLHLLAWEFYELLDMKTKSAEMWMAKHTDSLTIFGANGLNLSSTQVSDVSALAGLANLQTLYLRSTQVRDISTIKQLAELIVIA